MTLLMDTNLLTVRILSPKGLIYKGLAKSVSSANLKGKFDILPFHSNFITFLEKRPVKIIEADGKIRDFNFQFAILFNASNKVNIYTEIQTK